MTPRARLEHKKEPRGQESTHWLTLHAQVSGYLRERYWKHGFRNNRSFAWLNVGYAFAAGLSCMQKLSLDPWRHWHEGARRGFALAHPKE